jgi:PAS domain S-box-containing protein
MSEPREIEDLRSELASLRNELSVRDEDLVSTRQTLGETLARCDDLFALAPVAYVTLDRYMKIIELNKRATELLGDAPRGLLGMSFVARLVAVDVARFIAFFKDAATASGVREIEIQLKTNENEKRPIRFQTLTQALPPRQRAIRAMICDLTDLRAAESEAREFKSLLAEREARLDALLFTVPDAVLGIWPDGRIGTLNGGAERLLGLPSRDAHGQLVTRFLPAYFYKEPDLASPPLRELVARRSDGTTLPVEVVTAKLPFALGEVAVIRDVSERKKREAELQESLARYRQIAEGLEDAFYIMEASTRRFLYVSPAFEKILGWSPDPCADAMETWISRIDEGDRQDARAAWQAVFRGVPLDAARRMVRPDGVVRFVRHRCFPLLVHDRLTGIVQDVTDERQRGEQTRQLEKLESLGTVASGVAHDFNNLLMALGGSIALALKKLEPDHPARRNLDRALDTVARGSGVTTRLLRFVSKRAPAPEPVVVDAEVEGSQELLDRLVGDHVKVTFKAGAPCVRILADRGELAQGLINLAMNARDAMPKGGELMIDTRVEKGDELILTVRDTGVGMDAATQRRIFDPFFTTKDVGKGTGLGLPIVLDIVRRASGTIDVESATGRGTTFTIRLPIHDRAEPARAEAEPAPGGRETVLVVEDDPLVGEAVQAQLEGLGYGTLVAGSADEALRVFEENGDSVNLVLSDVMMPGVQGGDLAEQLRSRAPALEVLFMSAHPREELVRQGRIPADARLLSKPFDARALDAAVRGTLARHEAPILLLDAERRRASP